MADTNDKLKSLETATERLARQQIEAERSSRKLTNALDSLCNDSVDLLSKRVVESAKKLGVLTDEQYKLLVNSRGMVKSARDLADVMEEQERKYEALKKVQDKYQAVIEKAAKRGPAREAAAKALADKRLKQEAELHKISVQEAQVLLANMQAQRDATAQYVKHGKKIDEVTQVVAKHRDALTETVKKYVSLGAGIELLKASAKQMYGEFNKLTKSGLQGAFLTISREALYMKMSFDELSDVINQNRDLIAQLGGGVDGIENFSGMLKEYSKDLSHMGKEGTLATARFLQTLKSMNVDAKDTNNARKAMKGLQTQFKTFNAVYGDTAESYATLMETQMKEDGVQSRLIGLGKAQHSVIQQEIMARTENLKKIGMSNEQIVEFNRKLEDLYNPGKNNQQQRVSEMINLKNLVGQIIQQSPNSALASPEMQAKLREMESLQNRGANKEQMATWLSKNSKFAETLRTSITDLEQRAAANVDRGGDSLYTLNLINEFKNRSGSTFGILDQQGRSAAEARAKGVNYADDQAAYDEMVRKAREANEEMWKTLQGVRDVIQSVTALLDNSFGKAVLGMIATIYGMTKAFGLFGRAIGAITGMFGGSAAAGAAGAGAGAAGAGAGAAGAAGAGAAGSAAAGLGAGGVLATGGAVLGAVGFGAWVHSKGKEEREDAERKIIRQKIENGATWDPDKDAATIKDYKERLGIDLTQEKNAYGESPVANTKVIQPSGSRVAAGVIKSSPVGDLIARGESRGAGDYNANNRGTSNGKILAGNKNLDLTSMTIGEIMKRQSLPKSDPNRLFAVGRYQMIPDTLKEAVTALKLSKSEKFTPEVQEQLFGYLINQKRPEIGNYLSGKSNDINAAMLGASKEWASVANPFTGNSYYGSGNKASISSAEMSQALTSMRNSSITGMAYPDTNMPPPPPTQEASSAELRKQTDLLSQLVENTKHQKPSAVAGDRMFRRPASVVSNNMAS